MMADYVTDTESADDLIVKLGHKSQENCIHQIFSYLSIYDFENFSKVSTEWKNFLLLNDRYFKTLLKKNIENTTGWVEAYSLLQSERSSHWIVCLTEKKAHWKICLTIAYLLQENEMNWMAGKSKVVAVQFWEASASQYHSFIHHLHSPDFPLIEMNGSSIVRGLLSNGSLCFWNRWTLQAEQQFFQSPFKDALGEEKAELEAIQLNNDIVVANYGQTIIAWSLKTKEMIWSKIVNRTSIYHRKMRLRDGLFLLVCIETTIDHDATSTSVHNQFLLFIVSCNSGLAVQDGNPVFCYTAEKPSSPHDSMTSKEFDFHGTTIINIDTSIRGSKCTVVDWMNKTTVMVINFNEFIPIIHHIFKCSSGLFLIAGEINKESKELRIWNLSHGTSACVGRIVDEDRFKSAKCVRNKYIVTYSRRGWDEVWDIQQVLSSPQQPISRSHHHSLYQSNPGDRRKIIIYNAKLIADDYQIALVVQSNIPGKELGVSDNIHALTFLDKESLFSNI